MRLRFSSDHQSAGHRANSFAMAFLLSAILGEFVGCTQLRPSPRIVATVGFADGGRPTYWQRIAIDRKGADVYVNNCATPKSEMIELLLDLHSPKVDPDGPVIRSQVETWLVDCTKDVGAFLATAYTSGRMGAGPYLGVADSFADESDFAPSPDVTTMCGFLVGRRGVPAECSQ